LLSSSGKLGDYLSHFIQKHLVYNSAFGKLRCRADTLGYLQRSLVGMASHSDQQEAFLVGEKAVHFLMEGQNNKMVCLVRQPGKTYACTTTLCDLTAVAQKTKLMPRKMINADGNGVSEEFYEYALPLAGSLAEIQVLKLKPMRKKLLMPYVRP
jgi:6-phosphofructokinase 1